MQTLIYVRRVLGHANLTRRANLLGYLHVIGDTLVMWVYDQLGDTVVINILLRPATKTNIYNDRTDSDLSQAVVQAMTRQRLGTGGNKSAGAAGARILGDAVERAAPMLACCIVGTTW